MKSKVLLSALFLAALVAACDNTKNDVKTSDSDTTKTDTLSKPAEDKSKRESPPMESVFNINGVNVTVAWGSPKVKGRTVWGELVPYDEIWRSGANEATTVEFDKNAKVEGKAIAAGKYGFFTIPGKKEWTLIFNSRPDQWGAYEYEKEKDVLRVTVKPETHEMNENLIFMSENNIVYLAWEKLKVGFKVEAGE